MTTQPFDHQRLDIYRLSIEYVATSFATPESLTGRHRHARDQWPRAAPSIALNIAESKGKQSRIDRAPFLDIARGSAVESIAIQDVRLATKGIKVHNDAAIKVMLHRIVATLAQMAMKFDGVAETSAGHQAGIDYTCEHRFAEHEAGAKEVPKPSHAPEPGLRPFPH